MPDYFLWCSRLTLCNLEGYDSVFRNIASIPLISEEVESRIPERLSTDKAAQFRTCNKHNKYIVK